MNKEAFLNQFDQDGMVVLTDVLDSKEIRSLKTALEEAIEKEAVYHGGRDYKDYGMVLVCPLYSRKFIELVGDLRIMDPVNWILGTGSIVYAYTSSSMPPRKSNYSQRVHNDCPRFIPGYITNVGVIVLLDDFRNENGATWFLKGSHKQNQPPPEEFFFKNATRLIAQAGSVCYFHANIYHAGGNNETSQWRHALTLNMCRPYMKQRIDLPRALAHIDVKGINELSLQKLGFHSQVPASMEEYYLPLEERKYKQKVE